jgi:hypothetical protein
MNDLVNPHFQPSGSPGAGSPRLLSAAARINGDVTR